MFPVSMVILHHPITYRGYLLPFQSGSHDYIVRMPDNTSSVQEHSHSPVKIPSLYSVSPQSSRCLTEQDLQLAPSSYVSFGLHNLPSLEPCVLS